MKRFTCLLLTGFVSSGCDERRAPVQSPEVSAEATHAGEREHEALPRRLRLSEALAATSGLATELAVSGVLARTVGLPGEIIAEPDRTAKVAATGTGRLEQIGFNEGTLVKRGEVLAMLRAPDVGRLNGALTAATARARASSANADRLRSLKASGMGSAQAVVDAEADAQAQEAEARALAGQLGALGAAASGAGGSLIPIRAPIGGVVVSREAVLGQPVGPTDVLATIVDLSEVWFLGRVFEKDLSRLEVGAAADVQLNAYAGQHFGGVVDFVGQQIDPVARTLTARIRLANADARLRLGLFGTARVAAREANDAAPRVLIPSSAVADVGGRSIVFVKEKDGDFLVHDVVLGEAALERVQVLSGLDEGETVVSRGVFTLKSLLLKATLSEGD